MTGRRPLRAGPPSNEARLLVAVERLAHDVSTAVLSHCDLHCCDGTGPDDGHRVPDTPQKPTDPKDKKQPKKTDPIPIGTDTACEQARTGVKGQVAVRVAVATAPVPLDPTMATFIVPGALPGNPASPVDHLQQVPAGDDIVYVSLSTNQPVGAYVAHLCAQVGNMDQAFVIYLDGLP